MQVPEQDLVIGNDDGTIGRKFLLTDIYGRDTKLSKLHENQLLKIGLLNESNNVKDIEITQMKQEMRDYKTQLGNALRKNERLRELYKGRSVLPTVEGEEDGRQ